ncbi:VirD4-like conjugal transfer protein, CD1115 family [Lederbergia citrea]|uniref:VirD4-like conjugal transfer protein, CD1115 family n=1 Tax=Lederbergia citrea TaxID=2833581 RepID=UPI001BCA61B9|nr:type IV secretory system conjugative DNA transfer family protein [Lederbergia citrea]MBS4203666.1 type IV secretory system conjugative DNA transfer family protein [Lederbergia citrea]
MQDKQPLERLSSPKVLFLPTIGFLIVSFFLANFILAFLQAFLLAVEQFARDPDNLSFSIPRGSFLHFQGDILWFYAGFYLVVGIGLIKFLFNMRLNYQSLNKGQHGTSEFEKVNGLKKQYKIIPSATKEYDGNGGVIISGLQEKYRPYRLLIDEGPNHTMVIGITRSGKGETFVFPMLDVLSRAKNKPSLVVNDPKSELAAASYDTLVKRGYDVHVFNLIQQSMGMGFNPLQLVVDAWKKGNSSLAQQYANSVAYSLYQDPNAKDPFWSNSAKSLVTAIILALTEDAVATGKEEKVNMYSVANFLSTKGSDIDGEGNNMLDLFFKSRDDNNPARMMYATSNFAAGNTRASIFSTAMDKLQIFTLEPNAKLTSYNSMNLTDIGFGDKPVAVFMVTPDFDGSNHVLASIFVSQLYRVNAEKATMSPSGKMKRHVHFLLDEFGNMPTVEGMSGMVTVGAGRGFRFHLIIQAYSQIKSRYGEEADTIIGNCSNQIYILTKDEQTARQFSSLIGTKTITDVSRNGRLLSSDKSHSESVKERPLMMPDELMQLKEGQSVVVRANKRQDNKFRKIVPKPIFNKDVTSHKFRWEYLAGDFDNNWSLLELPIMSTTYHNLNLSEIVFTSKNEQELFVCMVDAMGKDAFSELKTDLRKVVISCGVSFEYENGMERWSFLHLLSYITYETPLSGPIIYKIFKSLRRYLPDDVLKKWDRKIRELREKQEKQRYRQEESIGETKEPMELDEKVALRKQVKGAV